MSEPKRGTGAAGEGASGPDEIDFSPDPSRGISTTTSTRTSIEDAWTLAELIADRRTSMDWSQRRLAEAVGVSESALRNWEVKGEIPTERNLKKLAAALDLTGAQLDRAVARTRRLKRDATEEQTQPADAGGFAGAKRGVAHRWHVVLGVGDLTIAMPQFKIQTWDNFDASDEAASEAMEAVISALNEMADEKDWRFAAKVWRRPSGDDDIPF